MKAEGDRMSKKAKNQAKTLLRAALKNDSALQEHVKDGMGAIKHGHKNYFETAIRTSFADSLELDEAMLKGHENENRWDYLLGHGPTDTMIAVEPHSAKQDQISTVINKRKMAKVRLQDHLKEGKSVSKWLWVASGEVHFANTEKARLKLDENGITFVGTQVKAKHIS